MLFDISGPDFLRVQRGGRSRISDPLDADVIMSGAFDDGQGYVYTVDVDAPGVGNGKTYTIPLTPPLAKAPIVIPGLRLTQPLVQNGVVVFAAGERVSPCYYRHQVSGQLPAFDYSFGAGATATQLSVGVAGMTGVATVLVVDL